MPGDYAVLAPVYDRAGLSGFADTMMPSLLKYLLRLGWMGRSILEIGSGTGSALRWLKQQQYNVTGVDLSPEMIRQAQQSSQGMTLSLMQQDVRRLETGNEYDLVIALNLLNELDSLRDLEATFKSVQKALKAGQLFVFDLQTLEGLAKNGNTERLFHDSPEQLTIFTRSAYDYERQMLTIRYLLFIQDGGQWNRAQAEQTLRAYPVQAVITLLQRSGFELTSVLTGSLAPYDPGQAGIERVLVIAKRI